MIAREACALVVGAWVVVIAGPARAAPNVARSGLDSGADDSFDDPKLSREAGARAAVARAAGASPVAAPAAAAAAVASKAASARAVAASPPAAPSHVLPSTDPAGGKHPPAGDVIARPDPASKSVAAAEPAADGWAHTPLLKLAYRRFPFSRIGAAATTTSPAGPTTPESFESLSLDVYPMSSYLRVGLSSQLGWESGQFDRSGDYFLAESASVGFQLPGRFTPFVEGLAGAGYMRRQRSTGTLPTGYWQAGIDAGVEIYVSGRAYASLAIGYLRPGNLFVEDQSLMSVKLDTWSLKIGLGI